MIDIYKMDYEMSPEGQLVQAVHDPSQPIPEGWTDDLSTLVPDVRTEQDQINRTLTMQLAMANAEIAKLKKQIGGGV